MLEGSKKADKIAIVYKIIEEYVLKKVREKPELHYKNDIDGYMDAGDNFYDIFQCKVND